MGWLSAGGLFLVLWFGSVALAGALRGQEVPWLTVALASAGAVALVQGQGWLGS